MTITYDITKETFYINKNVEMLLFHISDILSTNLGLESGQPD
jgi:hypothetical protein